MELAYIEETLVEPDRLLEALRTGTADRALFPVSFSSAKQGKGIQELLDGILRYLPAAAIAMISLSPAWCIKWSMTRRWARRLISGCFPVTFRIGTA